MNELDQDTILELIRFEVEDMFKQFKEDPNLLEKISLDFRARQKFDEAIKLLNDGYYEDCYETLKEVMDLIFT